MNKNPEWQHCQIHATLGYFSCYWDDPATSEKYDVIAFALSYTLPPEIDQNPPKDFTFRSLVEFYWLLYGTTSSWTFIDNHIYQSREGISPCTFLDTRNPYLRNLYCSKEEATEQKPHVPSESPDVPSDKPELEPNLKEDLLYMDVASLIRGGFFLNDGVL